MNLISESSTTYRWVWNDGLLLSLCCLQSTSPGITGHRKRNQRRCRINKNYDTSHFQVIFPIPTRHQLIPSVNALWGDHHRSGSITNTINKNVFGICSRSNSKHCCQCTECITIRTTNDHDTLIDTESASVSPFTITTHWNVRTKSICTVQ